MQIEILIKNNLPYVKLSNSHVLALNVGYVTQDYFITNNGDLCALFRISDFNFSQIVNLINQIEENACLQIYKYYKTGRTIYFVCITCRIDYSFLKPTWIQSVNFLLGPLNKVYKFAKISEKTIAYISTLIQDSFINANVFKNEVCQYLFDSNYSKKSNCGLIKTGEKKYVTSFSINNLGSLPIARNVLDSIDSYVNVITIIVPTKNRVYNIKNASLEKALKISMLNDLDALNENVQIHTIASSDNIVEHLKGNILYMNSKYLFTSEIIDSLSNIARNAQMLFNDRGIITYNHTVTGNVEFTAALPGNSYCGEHYHTVMQSISAPILNRLIQL